MKKKILSLTLTLALCLGLVIPAFAAESFTENCGDGITVTGYPNGSVSYTGAGKLEMDHAKHGMDAFWQAGNEGTTISISVGQGITITDEFKEFWSHEGFSATFNNSTTPVQPEQPQKPAGTIASPTNDKLWVDGVAANPTVYKINGSNYFKLRDLGDFLNIYVEWSADQGVQIKTAW